MNSSMLDFFDEKYFSPNCSCTDFKDQICLVHADQIQSGNSSIRCENIEPAVDSNLQNPFMNYSDTGSDDANPSYSNALCGMMTECVEINQSFPRQPTSEILSSVIEYRIKLISKEKCALNPGEVKRVCTTLKISRKPGKLAMFFKPPENLPLRFLNDGYINPSFRGEVVVQLQNPNSTVYYCPAGTVVGFLILTPFVQCC